MTSGEPASTVAEAIRLAQRLLTDAWSGAAGEDKGSSAPERQTDCEADARDQIGPVAASWLDAACTSVVESQSDPSFTHVVEAHADAGYVLVTEPHTDTTSVLTAACDSAEIARTARLEARWLVAHICGMEPGELFLHRDDSISPDMAARLVGLITRRAGGEPLQYLLGEWAFYGRPFLVGPGVLIPRQDSETLAETALRLLEGRASPRVLDLCTGSGCLAVTIACERPDCTVWALEKSPEAADYARQNTARNRACVTLLERDGLDPAAGEGLPPLDLIVCNPPYLTAADMAALQPEVRYEPALALAAGADGLDFYRKLTPLWTKQLAPGGALAYEIGAGQDAAVAEILRQSGYEKVCFVRDLCGIIRVVYARLPLVGGQACGGKNSAGNARAAEAIE